MNSKRFLFALTAILIGFTSKSQHSKKQQDIKSIKAMCGCYEVQFNFVETFNYAPDSLKYKPSKTKHDTGLEWVELVIDQPNTIALQHLLITGQTEEAIVKHWRQDWLYENTDLYMFVKDQTWAYKKLNPKEVQGQWTQKVYQVDDSPRYEGTSSWIHADGTDYWKNSTDAPLPRREHTTRQDYNVLKRRNIHEITKFGWQHEQDNDKIVRDEKGNDVLLAQEKGMDLYTKVADSKCKLAQDYWKKNNALWQKVRDKWETVFNKNNTLTLEKTVDKKPLFVKLFALKPDASKQEVDAIIDSFIKVN